MCWAQKGFPLFLHPSTVPGKGRVRMAAQHRNPFHSFKNKTEAKKSTTKQNYSFSQL